MKPKVAKWGLAPATAILSAIILSFLYQNCGKAGFEGADSGDFSSIQSIDPKLSKLPFPYKVSVNQIAFTSCPLSGAPETASSSYFTWKVGAFDNSAQQMTLSPAGLKLNPSFITEFNKLAPTYSSDMQATKLKEALMYLPGVASSKLNLSFRSPNRTRTDLMQMPTFNGQIINSPAISFMAPVSSSAVAESFKGLPTAPVNFFQNVEEIKDRSLEATLNIPSSLGNYQDLLYTTYASNYLTVGFMKEDASTADGLAGPSSDPKFAYGASYKPSFGLTNPFQSINGQPVSAPFSDSMVAISEIDPETGGNVPAGWDCSYRFKIVRRADAFNPVYRGANNFALVGGVCPNGGIVASAANPVCQLNSRPSFGQAAASFNLGGNCPAGSNRTRQIAGTYCIERYAYACPAEPYAVPTGANEILQTPPYMRGDGVYGSADSSRPQIMNALRRFLPADKWDVNVSQRCVVPKNEDGACYGSNPVVYDETFFPGAEANPSAGMFAGCGVAGQYPCAAYLTLCLRK
jgi:hypothetical protein